MHDLSRQGGEVDLWVYASLQSRPNDVNAVLRTREGGMVANCWVLHALFMRPASQTGGERVVHRLDLLPFGPPAVRDDGLVYRIPWAFGTGSADVSGVVIFGLSPRRLRCVL